MIIGGEYQLTPVGLGGRKICVAKQSGMTESLEIDFRARLKGNTINWVLPDE